MISNAVVASQVGRSKIFYDAVVNCPLCSRQLLGSKALVTAVPDGETGLGTFDILLCEDCSFGVTSPSPTEESLPRLYEQRSSSDFDAPSSPFIELLKDRLAFRSMKKLWQNLDCRPGLTCLDYGAGNGRFALALSRLIPGSNVYAADFHEHRAPSLDKSINYLSFDNLKSSAIKFDIIVQRHVLEHVKNPVETLSFINDRLNAGSIAYIEVPNFESAVNRIVGRRSPGWYVPRHLGHHSRASLSKAVSLACPNATWSVKKTNMPLMGNVVADFLNKPRTSLFCKIAGIILHPLQILSESLAGTSTCVYALIRKAS